MQKVSFFFLFFFFILVIFVLFQNQAFAISTQPRSNVRWKVIRPTPGAGKKMTPFTSGVDVIPYIRGDRKAIFVDFEGNFTNVESINYNLNYDTNENGTKRGVEGTVVPSPGKFDGTYNGNRYIRREYVLGTCSKNVCTYHSSPRNFKLTVKIKMKSGAVREDTKILEIQ